MQKIVKGLAVAACIGMFLVLLMGATVTQTDSGRGCGDDWPLCHGKFVPAYTIESIIEYSHRFVSGVVGLIILASTISVLWKVKRKDANIYALGALFFTLLQAGLGAAQVMNPQSEAILALHFGFSLLALTCTFLVVTSVWKAFQPPSAVGAKTPKRPITGGYKTAVLLTTLYAYIVVYTGAYVSHTDSGGGCLGFPLCNGSVVPAGLEGATAIAFTHRAAAYALFTVILVLAIYTNRVYGAYQELAKSARWSLALIVAQVLSGALMMALVASDYYVFGTLLHTIIISVLFAVLSYFSIAVWQAGRESRDASAVR